MQSIIATLGSVEEGALEQPSMYAGGGKLKRSNSVTPAHSIGVKAGFGRASLDREDSLVVGSSLRGVFFELLGVRHIGWSWCLAPYGHFGWQQRLDCIEVLQLIYIYPRAVDLVLARASAK